MIQTINQKMLIIIVSLTGNVRVNETCNSAHGKNWPIKLTIILMAINRVSPFYIPLPRRKSPVSIAIMITKPYIILKLYLPWFSPYSMGISGSENHGATVPY